MYIYKSEPFTIIFYRIDRNIHFQEAIYFKTVTGTHFFGADYLSRGSPCEISKFIFYNKKTDGAKRFLMEQPFTPPSKKLKEHKT